MSDDKLKPGGKVVDAVDLIRNSDKIQGSYRANSETYVGLLSVIESSLIDDEGEVIKELPDTIVKALHDLCDSISGIVNGNHHYLGHWKEIKSIADQVIQDHA